MFEVYDIGFEYCYYLTDYLGCRLNKKNTNSKMHSFFSISGHNFLYFKNFYPQRMNSLKSRNFRNPPL